MLMVVVKIRSAARPNLRGGGADSRATETSTLEGANSVPARGTSIGPASKEFNTNRGGVREPGPEPIPDYKCWSTAHAGPHTSEVHSPLEITTDGGVAQEVQESTSDTTTVGKCRDSGPQPEVVSTGARLDVSPILSCGRRERQRHLR